MMLSAPAGWECSRPGESTEAKAFDMARGYLHDKWVVS